MPERKRLPETIPFGKIGEVFEDLATEIADELLLEDFIDLHPTIRKLNNINQDESNYRRNKSAEEGSLTTRSI